ncbi:hypothetical protein PCCS19_15360 [Paenibacillus sp. CCS19]|uniref:hypothetical protein n=1 Tax=Paenibacillus sp. CCS19 TaxID=3158387 RepID=UPI00255F31B4|nr:hypothetical protein [Paenibacillus cellulosilyticus]GMK38482.1 hypothetical protein PCCS19_15360 [Paenibacillus cellulosilyticus]
MTKYKGVVIVPIAAVCWYLWGFYLYAFIPWPDFDTTDSKSIYEIIYTLGLWSFIAFTLFLLGYIINFFFVSKEVRWKTKIYTLLFGVSFSLVVGNLNHYWWYEIPPVSELKAIQIADAKIGVRLERYEYKREVYWDRINHEWDVIYVWAEGGDCDEVNINRVYTMTGSGTCKDMLARAVASANQN